MTKQFTASNGVHLFPKDDGEVNWKSGQSPLRISTALREYMLHEAGIWCDPVRGVNVLRVPDNDVPGKIAVVLFKDGGTSFQLWTAPTASGKRHDCIVGRYFAAHPQSKPEWHSTNPGEVWLITADCNEYIAIVDEEGDFELHSPGGVDLREYIYADKPNDLARITAGERIHPRKETV